MRQSAILAGLCFWGATAFAADPELLNLVMPNAKLVAGVNVTTAKTSAFGQFLLAQIAAKPIPPIVAATGFDPRADLTGLLFASAEDPSNPGGLALARGIFNVDQIVSSVRNHPNIAVQTYDGDTILIATDPNQKIAHAVAFIGSSIAVAGDVTDVEAALDRSNGKNSLADSTLAAEVNSLSASNDAWIASSVGVPAKKPQALTSITSFQGGVLFGASDQANVQATTGSPQNAAALASVIQLFVMASTKNPALNQVLQLLQANVTGSTLNLSFSIPETQVESLINGLEAQRQQEHSSVRAPRPAVR
jgi:hypothetical protein